MMMIAIRTTLKMTTRITVRPMLIATTIFMNSSRYQLIRRTVRVKKKHHIHCESVQVQIVTVISDS